MLHFVANMIVLLEGCNFQGAIVSGNFAVILYLLLRGVYRGMEIYWSVPFFAKTVDPPTFLFKYETTTTSGNRSVKV